LFDTYFFGVKISSIVFLPLRVWDIAFVSPSVIFTLLFFKAGFYYMGSVNAPLVYLRLCYFVLSISQLRTDFFCSFAALPRFLAEPSFTFSSSVFLYDF